MQRIFRYVCKDKNNLANNVLCEPFFFQLFLLFFYSDIFRFFSMSIVNGMHCELLSLFFRHQK